MTWICLANGFPWSAYAYVAVASFSVTAELAQVIIGSAFSTLTFIYIQSMGQKKKTGVASEHSVICQQEYSCMYQNDFGSFYNPIKWGFNANFVLIEVDQGGTHNMSNIALIILYPLSYLQADLSSSLMHSQQLVLQSSPLLLLHLLICNEIWKHSVREPSQHWVIH